MKQAPTRTHIARPVSSRVTSYPDLLLRQQEIWVRGNLEEASLFLELSSGCFLSLSSEKKMGKRHVVIKSFTADCCVVQHSD